MRRDGAKVTLGGNAFHARAPAKRRVKTGCGRNHDIGTGGRTQSLYTPLFKSPHPQCAAAMHPSLKQMLLHESGRHDMPSPLQVANIFVFIRQVASIPAYWLFKTSATS